MADRTWQYDYNRSLSDNSTAARMNSSVLWYWKAFILGQVGGATLGLWTMDQCCDSTQVKTDGTDLFGLAYDNTKWVRNTEGNAHSWLVLKSPSGFANGPWYLTINLAGSTDAVPFAAQNIRISRTQPSGGTTTAAPTTTAYFPVVWASLSMSIINTAATGVTHYLSGILSTNGDWNVTVVRSGASTQARFGIMQLIDALSDDQNPIVAMARYSSTGAYVSGDFSSGQTNSEFTSIPPHKDLTTFAMDGRILEPYILSGFSSIGATADVADSRQPTYPMYAFVYGTQASLRGRLPDWWFSLSTVAEGSTFPSVGTTLTKFGNVIIPADTAPNL